jgi:hypothetical protein
MLAYWKPMKLTLIALLAVLLAGVASAQERDEYGDVIQGDYHPDDIVQTVARISHLQGAASYSRGDNPDDWQAADVNVPMSLGDRLYTSGRSRLELQVQGGDVIQLGARTDLAALNLTEDTKQFAVKSGIASFHVRRLDQEDTWEVDTPNAAVTFEQPGDYRIDVDRDGNTRVAVRRGAASVAAGGGQVSLDSGDALAINGIDSPRYSVVSLSGPDRWDRWVEGRRGRLTRAQSYQYVSADVVGADDLDEYGRWEQIPDYGRVWTPASVQVGWAPYRAGHWVWQDPWGWTWISSEPWGWAPYHYGRWVTYSSRWYWVPVGPTVRTVAYSPALVAFVGGGPGFSASVTIGGGGFVGWFPLAPRDPFNPWWASRGDTNVNVNITNVTYVNRNYVTVVNQNTFVSGAVVTRNIVTDRAVVRQVASAPVVRGIVPVVPTAASTRVSSRTDTRALAIRPPSAVASRSVVARVAPPPAPPRFDQKLDVIRQNGGRPVTQAAATRLISADQRQPRASVAIRPAAAEPGRVTLAPSNAQAERPTSKAPAVQPVAPVRGRAMATAERPVAAGPVTGNKLRERGTPPQTRIAPTPGSAAAPPIRERAEPAQPPARIQPTPQAERPGRESVPERERVQTTPNWRARQQPTAREEPPAGAVAPERERIRIQQVPTPARERYQPTPREEPQTRELPPGRERVQAPPAAGERYRPTPREEPQTREVPPGRERVQAPSARVQPTPADDRPAREVSGRERLQNAPPSRREPAERVAPAPRTTQPEGAAGPTARERGRPVQRPTQSPKEKKRDV